MTAWDARTGRRPQRLLSIAGSDPSGGAGIQADLKTFAAHDAYGMAAITAITAQSTLGVLAVEPIAADLVERQIRGVLDDVGVDGIKIGMLGSAAIAAATARPRTSRCRRRRSRQAIGSSTTAGTTSATGPFIRKPAPAAKPATAHHMPAALP